MVAGSTVQRSSTFPERIGRYELIMPIGSGGMASVYLARALGVGGFERQVAVKLMHQHLQQNEQHSGDLFDEARFAARIHHRNVVQVIDVGDETVGAYLVMEYVDGETLASVARAASERGTSIPARVALRVVCDALAGLHAAHGLRGDNGEFLNLVHRDFSPQNLLIDVDGTTRLTDFGVVKALGRSGHTQTGLVKGKIAYMSPEQVRGESLDRRTDVWAAGVVAWELLANRRLFGGKDDVTTLMRVLGEPAPRLRSLGVDVSESIDDAIASALEPDLVARCPSAFELRSRLLAGAPAGVADHVDVAELLAELVGHRISERRARAQAILRERVRHRDADERGLGSPSSIDAATPPREPPSLDATVPEFPAVDVSSPVTELSVVAPQRRPRGPRALGVAIAVLLGAASVAAAVLHRNSDRADGDAVTRAPQRSSEAGVPVTDHGTAPRATAPALASEAVQHLPVEQTGGVVSPGAPASAPRGAQRVPTSKPPPRIAPPKAPTASVAPPHASGLASNPYRAPR